MIHHNIEVIQHVIHHVIHHVIPVIHHDIEAILKAYQYTIFIKLDFPTPPEPDKNNWKGFAVSVLFLFL